MNATETDHDRGDHAVADTAPTPALVPNPPPVTDVRERPVRTFAIPTDPPPV